MKLIVTQEEWNKHWQDGFREGLASRPTPSMLPSPSTPQDEESE